MFTIISFFQKLIKKGVGIRAGGLENFSKINKRGDDYSVLESTHEEMSCHQNNLGLLRGKFHRTGQRTNNPLFCKRKSEEARLVNQRLENLRYVFCENSTAFEMLTV